MFRWISVALFGFLVACSSSTTAGSACTDNSSCAAGLVCINSICTTLADMAPPAVDMAGMPAPDMVAAVVPPICSSGGWCWQNPLPQGNNLRGVWASAPNSMWAVGDGGTILYWNGTGWSQQSIASQLNLNAVWVRQNSLQQFPEVVTNGNTAADKSGWLRQGEQ